MAQTATASIACKMVASSIMLVARAGGKFVGRAGVNLIEGVAVGGVRVDQAEQERVVGRRIVAVRVVHVVHSVNATDALTHVNVTVEANAIRAALESAGVIFHSSRLLLRIG
jgi:hypothetical protein